jgi:tetrahydromethanopterin S-methyltransferase subunit F
MMSRATRRARYQQEDGLEISLFPFLSIFLCVMGVLSFINVLSSFSAPQKIELTAQLETGYKVAYQIFSLPDGVISVPPTKYLRKLQTAADETDKEIIDVIIQQREHLIEKLKNHTGSIMNAAIEPDIDDILDTVHDIRTLNEIALRNDYLYEEFILFGIYPNGSQAYQKIRDVMILTQDSAGISIGLEPLDSNWTLNLNNSTSKGNSTK